MPNITACISVDWEGRDLEGIGSLQKFNAEFSHIPITHFISAAYLARTTNSSDLETIAKAMAPGIKPTDEVALHIHCWTSLYSYTGGFEYTTKPRGPAMVKYAGQTYTDDGYVIALCTLEESDINMLYDMSIQKLAPLLTELKNTNNVVYTIDGFRAGGWMADNSVFNILQMKGLTYDASAVDCLFGARARKEYVKGLVPMVQGIARLWGPKQTTTNSLNWNATLGSGVGRMTGPYKIGSLIELPNNGMLVSAVESSDVKDFLQWAVDQPETSPVFVSIGFHQETPAFRIDEFIDAIKPFAENPDINWLTHIACARSLA